MTPVELIATRGDPATERLLAWMDQTGTRGLARLTNVRGGDRVVLRVDGRELSGDAEIRTWLLAHRPRATAFVSKTCGHCAAFMQQVLPEARLMRVLAVRWLEDDPDAVREIQRAGVMGVPAARIETPNGPQYVYGAMLLPRLAALV